MKKIKLLLSEFLGTDAADINNDDSLREDLHMSPTDLTDFSQILTKNGFESDDIDLTEIETVTDLAEALSIEDND